MNGNTVRRVTFNLDDFVLELNSCLTMESRNEEIDDVVQGYKDFYNRISDDLKIKVRSYIDKRVDVSNNPRLKSFISACYK